MEALRREAGFTLPELLVAAAVLLLLVVGASFLLRPANHEPESRNGVRWTSVALLGQGLRRYYVDHGRFPEDLPTKDTLISSEEGGYDLCPALVPAYMDDLPLDPQTGAVLTEGSCAEKGAVYVSGYTIRQNKDGSIVVAAPTAEKSEKISLVVVAAGVRYE